MPPNNDIYIINTENGLQNEFQKDKIDSDEKKRISFDEALGVCGFGLVQYMTLFVCGLILMAVITETMGMSIIVPAAQCDLSLTAGRKGIITAVSFIGIMVASLLWGYLADTKGRRKIIVCTLFISVLCTVASSFVNNFWIFVAARFLSGFFIAGSAATIYAYVGEFNRLRNRATVVACASVFVAFGNIFIAGFGWIILSIDWSYDFSENFEYKPWRLLLIIYTLPGFIGGILIYFLPESPKFLLSQGREEECLKVLQWIFKKNTGKTDFPVTHLISEFDQEHYNNTQGTKGTFAAAKSLWQQTIPLLRKPLRCNFLICCVVMFGSFFVSGGMGLWFPDIQNKVSFISGERMDKTVCQVLGTTGTSKVILNTTSVLIEKICDDTVNSKTFIDAMWLSAFYLGGYAIYACTIKFVGRSIIYGVFLFGSGAAGLALQWITNLDIMLVCFCLHIILAGICISVTGGAVVDLFPTKFKAMAVCIVLMSGRFGSVVGSNVIGILLEVNCSATFYLYSIFIIGCGALALLLPRR